jgi:hypothetical protein
MRQVIDRGSLANWFEDHLATHGECVWDTFTQVDNAIYSLPHMWTTFLINIYRYGASHIDDPGSWICETNQKESVRLFLREGEFYLADRSRQFKCPVSVQVKSEKEFVCIKQVPIDRWWEAPFVCPFCSLLATPDLHCEHLLIFDGWVIDRYQSSLLRDTLKLMHQRRSNINFANLELSGLRIKMQRDFYGNLEWFRSACWYIRSPEILKNIEGVLVNLIF